MSLTGISLLGWVHSFACLLAIITGAYVLGARKGTHRHRIGGWWYAMAMIVQSLLVMGIYRFDIIPGPGAKPGPHIFGFFHWSSLLALAATALALFSARRQRGHIGWGHAHAQAMLFSYYLLVSGLINELFARVTLLRRLALAASPLAKTTLNTLLVRDTQAAGLIAWAALTLWLAWTVAGRRKPPLHTTGHPLRYSGGVMVAIVGASILIGDLLGTLTWGVVAGMALGIGLSRRAAVTAASVWGTPSVRQGQALAVAIGLEITVFFVLGGGGLFASLNRMQSWQVVLAVIGLHFLPMRWSHGRLMPALGTSVLAWLALSFLLNFPLWLIAMGDGALKLVFGMVMAWPLLAYAAKAQFAPGYRQGWRPPGAGSPG